MDRVLVLDNERLHAEEIAECLRSRNMEVTICDTLRHAERMLRHCNTSVVLIVINVSDSRRPWGRIIRKLQEVCFQHCSPNSPALLCVSRIQREPQFELYLEQAGARLVYES